MYIYTYCKLFTNKYDKSIKTVFVYPLNKAKIR